MSDGLASSLIKNTFSLTVGRVLSLILNFVALAVAVRFLDVDEFGEFNTVLAFILIVSKFVDMGFAPIVFREVSGNKLEMRLLNTALIIRFGLLAIAFIVVNSFSELFNLHGYSLHIANLLLLNIVFSAKIINFRELLEIPFKSDLKTVFPMACSVLDNFAFVILIGVMLVFKGGIIFFTVAYVFSNLPGMMLILWKLWKEYNFKMSFKIEAAGYLLKESFPIFIFALLTVLYQQSDILMIKYYGTKEDVAFYSAGLRLITPLLILPAALVNSIFPVITKLKDNDQKRNNVITNIVFKILYLFSFGFAVTIFFKSDEVIGLIFGDRYSVGGLSAALLFCAQIFAFYNFLAYNIIIIYKKQKWNIYYAVLLLLMNVVTNLILIPEISFVGAAYSKIISAFAGTIFCAVVLYKLNKVWYLYNIKTIIWSVATIGVVYLYNNLSLFLYLVLSIISFCILIFVFRFFEKEEILSFFKAINKEKLGQKFIAVLP